MIIQKEICSDMQHDAWGINSIVQVTNQDAAQCRLSHLITAAVLFARSTTGPQSERPP